MSETTQEPTPTPPPTSRWRVRLLYAATIVTTAIVVFLITAVLMNIRERKEEGQQHFVKLVELDENTVDPAIWGQNFPRQYASYRLTADNDRDTRGASDGMAPSKLEADPRLRRIFAGYAFSIDYRERRGHAYMLYDQEQTERIKQVKQPGACLHCHASVLPAYRKEGGGDITKGFEKVCAMPYAEAHQLISHPVACIDCHDPKTIQLRVQRPAFIAGIQALARSDADVPHLPSIKRWREGPRREEYDVNTLASRQEMRSLVCGQCHVEYYFKGTGKLLTYPWHKGLKVEQIEAYYDEVGFTDWKHAETGAPILKAQHPEFELWSQGIHARSGVACADCHMPYVREGAIKVSDHQVRSPMKNIARACQTCHRYPEQEIRARTEAIQQRTQALQSRAEDALLEMMDALQAAKKRGVPAEKLAPALALHRKAQWRVDFVASENSRGFHAPQESARILAEAIDFARQAQLKAQALPEEAK
jgi:nitrite reductase (cytochrome c-552)